MAKSPHSSDSGGIFKGVGSHIKHSVEEMTETILSTALRIPDPTEATKRLVDLVRSSFKAKFGKRMTELDEQIVQLEEEQIEAKVERDDTRKCLKQTKEHVPSCQANHGLEDSEMKEVPFSDWQARHRLEATLMFASLGSVIGASFMTAYTNLVGSGLTVFEDYPLLPVSMALLAPLAGLAIKSIYSFLRSSWAKNGYVAGLVVASLTSISAWIILYADMYHGLSSNVSAGGLFDEPTFWDQIRDVLFIIVSLSTEILIGALLAVRLTIIANNYSPDYFYPNPEFKLLTKKLAGLDKLIASQNEEVRQLKGERAEFDGSLELQIQILQLAHEGRRNQPSTPIL